LNLLAGPGCQQPRATESVSADSVRPIRTEINGGEPSSPPRRGLDKTLALATRESGARLTEGHRGRLGWLQGGGGLSEVSSASEACRRRSSRWCVAVLIRVALGFRRGWRCPHAAREEMRCGVRFKSSRGREGCRERAEGDGRRRPKLSPSTPAPVTFLELTRLGNGWGSSVGCSGWRGEGLGEEWRPGEGFGRSSGFYTPAVDSVLVVSSIGDWAAGRCVLGGIVDYVYGCGPWHQWLNVSVGNVSGSVCTHERSSSFPSCRLATEQRGWCRLEGSWCLADSCSARCGNGHALLGMRGSLSALSACRRQGQSEVTGRCSWSFGRGLVSGHGVEGAARRLARLGGQACCISF
jgi:hypothetical protein